MKLACLSIVATFLLPASPMEIRDAKGRTVKVADATRIVAIGASAGEILSALGAERRLVAVGDNPYPESLKKLPQVSARHSVSAEGVIAQNPGVVVAALSAQPATAFEQIQQSGIPTILLPADASIPALEQRVRILAQLVGEQQKGESILRKIRQQIDDVRKRTATVEPKRRVLFVMSARGAGTAAGKRTPIDAMIELAGGVNAVTQFEGFKPVTPEASASVDPDIVLVPFGGHGFSDPRDVFREPGLSMSKAAKSGSVIAMDLLYLMGFGPRMGNAVQDLAHHFYPQLVPPSTKLHE